LASNRTTNGLEDLFRRDGKLLSTRLEQQAPVVGRDTNQPSDGRRQRGQSSQEMQFRLLVRAADRSVIDALDDDGLLVEQAFVHD
jgi:hypothetical protein